MKYRYYLQKHSKRHAEAEALGIPLDSLAADIDDGLKERKDYIKMGQNEYQNGTFDCNECGETFSKFCKLTKHRRAEHNFDNELRSKNRGRSCPSRYKKQEHEPELSLNVTAAATATAKIADNDDLLTVMERKPWVRNHPHQPKSEFICETCDITFKQYDSIKEHMTSKHSNKDSFMCYKCNRTYPNRYYLQKHMKRHQSDQAQGEADHLDDNLVERMWKVHPHRPKSNFVCDFCQKTVRSYYSIRDHILSKHVSKKKETNKRSRKQMSCSQCDKKFVSIKCFKKHMLGHDINTCVVHVDASSEIAPN